MRKPQKVRYSAGTCPLLINKATDVLPAPPDSRGEGTATFRTSVLSGSRVTRIPTAL